MDRMVVVGASGLARMVVDIVEKAGDEQALRVDALRPTAKR